MRFFLALLIPVVIAQTPPLQIRPGEKPGTVQIRVPGAELPLVEESGAWTCTLEVVYHVMAGGGRELDRATETVPLRFDKASRDALQANGPGPGLTLTRPMPAGNEVAELRVEITARPAGTLFAGSMKVESQVALIPFRVKAAKGKLAAGLTAEDLEVLEDGVSQRLNLIAGGPAKSTEVPVDIIVLYDRRGGASAGEAGDPEEYRKGLLAEFPNARVAIYGLGARLHKLIGPTRDEVELARAAEKLRTIPGAETRLFASIRSTILEFDQRRAALKMLVVFSNGVSTSMPDVEDGEAVTAAAREAGVSIYPVRVTVGQPGPARKGEVRRPAPVNPLASRSGGAFTRLAESGGDLVTILAGTDGLPMVLREIGKTLRQTYVASYQPEAGGAARAREVRVVLKDSGLGTVIGGTRVVVR